MEIKNNEQRVGWLTLDPVKTEALPRIGEAVALHDDLFLKDMRLRSDSSYLPEVMRVEHALCDNEGSIVVTIVVEMAGTVDNIRDFAEKNGLRWLPR